ncbi:MAG TPA: LysM peptidoglycan-binding domain-containing protein, partial [Aggregatilineales bacterium]|nr:LysM peptidoglycan-binding domain-containing protein [Aggregatilineales bacterium]
MSRRETQTAMLMILLGIVVALLLSTGLMPTFLSSISSLFPNTPTFSLYSTTPGTVSLSTLVPSGFGITIQIGPSGPTGTAGATPTPFFFAPQVTAGTATPTGACAGLPGWRAYTVQPGDTLGALAAPTGLAVQQIAYVNCLGNADTLQVGQIIYLPAVRVTSTPLG